MPAASCASSSTAAYTQYFTVSSDLNLLPDHIRRNQNDIQMPMLHQGHSVEEGKSDAGEMGLHGGSAGMNGMCTHHPHKIW